ncbi:hypothetical protein FRC04_007892 [Tulasnella sp. 424]|nr:hypothetical protein FRC04_007892 [Tulasnella sp. 424]KAG8975076.1 hypothetical protein FRC05_006499 [Tulasnella sp. 425]
MNPPTPTTKPNSLIRPAHSSDAEFDLLDDDSTDLGLSELRLGGDQARSSRGIGERKPERSDIGVDVVDTTIIRALRQNILSKYHAEESRHIPAPTHVKIFFTSDVRPGLAILQSGEGVVELDLSPHMIRVLPESLIFWSKSSTRGSVGFFIQRRHLNGHEHHTAAGPSNGRPTSVSSDPCNFELLTPSKDSAALVYWGTMQILPYTLPDLHEQELKALPRQTRNDLCEVLDQPDQLGVKRSSSTNDSTTVLSEPAPKFKCIGFRRVGMNPNLCGQAEWSRQKLSLDAREYLLARRTDPDLVPLLDIPKTARRIRRLPKASKVQTPERKPSAYWSNSPKTRLEFKPAAITSGTTRSSIQDLSTDFDTLGMDPPIFRASKRKRDESTVVTTGDTDGLVVGRAKGKTRRVETGDGPEEEMDAKDTGQKKSRKTERKMKKSRARKKQDREIRKMAAVLDGLSIGQLGSDEDSIMEK